MAAQRLKTRQSSHDIHTEARFSGDTKLPNIVIRKRSSHVDHFPYKTPQETRSARMGMVESQVRLGRIIVRRLYMYLGTPKEACVRRIQYCQFIDLTLILMIIK